MEVTKKTHTSDTKTGTATKEKDGASKASASKATHSNSESKDDAKGDKKHSSHNSKQALLFKVCNKLKNLLQTFFLQPYWANTKKATSKNSPVVGSKGTHDSMLQVFFGDEIKDI